MCQDGVVNRYIVAFVRGCRMVRKGVIGFKYAIEPHAIVLWKGFLAKGFLALWKEAACHKAGGP